MNNSSVERLLDDCSSELDHLKTLVDEHGPASAIVPFLNKYAVIRACGSIEQSFKTIIADFCSARSKRQVKRFLNKRVREASSNPSYKNMCQYLKEFDEAWWNAFKGKLDTDPAKVQRMSSLSSLVDARNEFAHGGSPGASINDVRDYFDHARKIVEYMDEVVA
jgi:hypothetical protein